jgi:hypothetical protein
MLKGHWTEQVECSLHKKQAFYTENRDWKRSSELQAPLHLCGEPINIVLLLIGTHSKFQNSQILFYLVLYREVLFTVVEMFYLIQVREKFLCTCSEWVRTMGFPPPPQEVKQSLYLQIKQISSRVQHTFCTRAQEIVTPPVFRQNRILTPIIKHAYIFSLIFTVFAKVKKVRHACVAEIPSR